VETLPPRISDPKLFRLLADILAVRPQASHTAQLRLRLIDKTTSWQALTDLAIDQGVFLPLVWSLTRRSLVLPVPKMAGNAGAADHPTAQLETHYRQQIQRRHDQRSQLIEITIALNQADVVPLLLKGARYLADPVGPWCEARGMRDLDVLVRPGDAPRAIAALERAGYEAAADFGPVDQHLPEMWHAGRPSAVEIHTESLSFSGRKLLGTDVIWAQAAHREVDNGRFFVLPNEWQLLHACLNHQVSDHGHARHMLAVKPLWEFAMLGSELTDEGWRSIADHIAATGKDDILASWVVEAGRLFGLAHPQWLKISPAARAHAEATFARASAWQWRRRGRFLIDQLRFAFARETLAQRYGLKESDVSLRAIGPHLRFLARRYRGRWISRITGRRDRLS